ncbi:5-(carboxyamino)imidazole ribonucleotide synthase [Caloramator australicus]|uniref:N5-carboxyaminoimidazole ribonucleotide synthase n=1 Tax=Caloramator australicus RC3 TaxID=857293 RepID=I7LGR2_9CLOT|nr:5-(carboxyamino)imidazole ribonucleotide synthase [Caloramator australicus]CCJ33460.1 Phosphoribosylaminoimidazole carboxylase ATPase subunit [Caloramator australicus RC3]
MNKVYLPPSRIGVIGGGQLGRMLAFEAKRMGYEVFVLDPKENSPAGQVSDFQFVASFDDFEALLSLAQKTDIITYEFEHINVEHLLRLKEMGYKIYPSPETLKIIQNKYLQREYLKRLGLPVPKFKRVESFEDLIIKAGQFSFPLMLKHARGGYDGKGNILIKGQKDLEEFKNFDFKREIFIEEYINFKKEISIILCRNLDGDLKFYLPFENYHEDSILKITKCPADIKEDVKKEAINIAKAVLEGFDDVGVFCIEMFLDYDDRIYINEIAPRVHNSGHLTIEAFVSSQFENHLRSIANLPLGSTELLKRAAMINILGDRKLTGKYTIEGFKDLLKMDGIYVHLYGKDFVDNKKKIGHVTVIGETDEEINEKIEFVKNNLKIGEFNG